MKLATVVVLYYPDLLVADNIASYARYSDFLYIWDNTPGLSSNEFYTRLKDGNIQTTIRRLHFQQKNMGLAYAYNRAIEEAEKDHATHLMTMDQDSSFEKIEVYRSKIERNTDKTIGLFVPPVNHYSESDKAVTWAAQSGCVFDMAMIRQIGMFREDFFIGMVDVEMQLKAAEAGYKMIQLCGCRLNHRVGSGRKAILWGKAIPVSDYNPLRHYYDSRNRILMWHEFPNDYDMKGKARYFVGRLKLIVKILLFENNKSKKIAAIIRGTRNGLFNRVIPYNT